MDLIQLLYKVYRLKKGLQNFVPLFVHRAFLMESRFGWVQDPLKENFLMNNKCFQ